MDAIDKIELTDKGKQALGIRIMKILDKQLGNNQLKKRHKHITGQNKRDANTYLKTWTNLAGNWLTTRKTDTATAKVSSPICGIMTIRRRIWLKSSVRPLKMLFL